MRPGSELLKSGFIGFPTAACGFAVRCSSHHAVRLVPPNVRFRFFSHQSSHSAFGPLRSFGSCPRAWGSNVDPRFGFGGRSRPLAARLRHAHNLLE